MMKLQTSSVIQLPIEEAWRLLQRVDTLNYVAYGFMQFRALDDGELPEQWLVGTEKFRVLLWNVIPAWVHTVHIKHVDDDIHHIDTHETGGLIKRWDHDMKLDEVDENSCRYTDSLDLDVGWITPLAWVMAKAYYRYRHWRWKKLVRKALAAITD